LLSRNIFDNNDKQYYTLKENKDKNIDKKTLDILNILYIPQKLGYGTHSYIINKKAIHKIKDELYPINEPIDILFNKWHEKDKLKIYVSSINLTIPIDFKDSDTDK
jgi:hypothetical protein